MLTWVNEQYSTTRPETHAHMILQLLKPANCQSLQGAKRDDIGLATWELDILHACWYCMHVGLFDWQQFVEYALQACHICPKLIGLHVMRPLSCTAPQDGCSRSVHGVKSKLNPSVRALVPSFQLFP